MRALALLVLTLVAAGCATPEALPDDARTPVSTDAAGLRPIEETFQGTATGTPVAPGVNEFKMQVPSGAVGVNGTLVWDAPAARLRLELLDEDGELAATGWQEADGRISLATVEPPRPGEWTFRVVSQVAANVPFTLTGRVELLVPENNLVRDTVELGAASFYEVNLIMEGNASFTFTFSSDQPLRWDIHSHPPEGLKEWAKGEGTEANHTFTAPARGVYSVLFENPGAVPANVDFEVAGRFRIHSHGG